MTVIKKVLLVLAVSLNLITYAKACDCDQPDFIQSKFGADLILKGTLIGFEDTESVDVLATFKIIDIYKGNYSDSTIKIDGPENLLNKQKKDLSSCSWEAMKGVKYILYLQKDKNGLYKAGYCMRRVAFGSEQWEKEVNWLNDSSYNYNDIYFNYGEVETKPLNKSLDKKLIKVEKSIDNGQKFIVIELKISDKGKLVEANLIDPNAKPHVERVYDRYISQYKAYLSAINQDEKEVLEFAKSLKKWAPGKINGKKVNVKIMLVVYEDEISKKLKVDLN